MSKKSKELSALAVSRLTTPGHHTVGGVSGLYLYVTNSGARSWVLRVVVGDKRRHMGLGGFPDISLAMARERAREARAKVESGIDPIQARLEARSLLRSKQASMRTFEQAANAYLEAHGDSWKNAKHRAQWSATLSTYAYPVMGDLSVQDVGQEQVLLVLEPIWKTKTETANRLRGRIERVLDWATVRKYRTGENPARWKGHLDKLLPAPKRVQKVTHMRALPFAKLPAFMADLKSKEGTSVKALEFAILCASRSGEVRGATWAEMDLIEAVWTIPADRMKAGKEHRVPLTDLAIKLLRALPNISGSDYVFANSKGTVLSDMSLTAVLRRMKVDAVPHGFRSTFRDWAGDQTRHPRDVVEMALAHALENKVEAAYRRGDALDKRRLLMNDWAGFCYSSTAKAIGPQSELGQMFSHTAAKHRR